jgi:hypothetical protein
MRFVALYSLFAATLSGADPATFTYDSALPLNIREHEVATRNGVRVATLNFAATPTAQAEGLLVTPSRGKTKTAAIVWMHSGGSFEQLPDAMLLAQAGAVSLLIDPISPDWSAAATTWRERMVQAVVSIRRGVGLLLQRNDIDPQRLGFVGHSYGAMIGVDAVAADRRFRAAVFEVGLPGLSVHIRTAPIAFAADIRTRLGPELDSALGPIEPLDSIHYVGALAPAALLFSPRISIRECRTRRRRHFLTLRVSRRH